MLNALLLEAALAQSNLADQLQCPPSSVADDLQLAGAPERTVAAAASAVLLDTGVPAAV